MTKTYYTYITTNPERSTLYVGMTNNLVQRMIEHYLYRGTEKSFAGEFYCYNLLYFEEYHYPNEALDREKQIKRWRREKKEWLISLENPDWIFLNDQLCEWPPRNAFHRAKL